MKADLFSVCCLAGCVAEAECRHLERREMKKKCVKISQNRGIKVKDEGSARRYIPKSGGLRFEILK